MIARLATGVTIERAQSELTKIHKAIAAEHPEDYGSQDALVAPLQREVTLMYRPALFALGAAVGLMLIIAIANMATLQLARLVRREEEFAIRTALGASSPRLTRQLLTEALLIGVLGGIAGLAVAWVAIPALVRQLRRSFLAWARFISTWRRSP
jgi:ABC-type antimicrobial peptide transport system permease subunit